MRFLLLVFVACGLSVVACERSSPVEPQLPICAMGTAVTVGAGVQPTISWTGGCRVTEVRVEAAEGLGRLGTQAALDPLTHSMSTPCLLYTSDAADE